MIVSNIIFVAILKTGYTALIISQVVTNVVQLLMYVAIPRYIYKFKYVSKEYIHKLLNMDCRSTYFNFLMDFIVIG